MKKPIFRIKDNKGNYHFNFILDGVAEGMSEIYTSLEMAVKGLQSVRVNCSDLNNYEMRDAKNGQVYFVLKAQNGEIIFTSIMFWNQEARNQSIELLKEFGKTAELVSE